MPVEWRIHDYDRECGARRENHRCTLTEPHIFHQERRYTTPGSDWDVWVATWSDR